MGSKHGKPVSFSRYLEDLCSIYCIDLIAEEMSLEALGQNHSTAALLAKKLGIPHQFCDPSPGERIALGIPSDGEIRSTLGLGRVLTVEQDAIVKNAEQAYWHLREAEWYRRVKSLLFSNCLFILGANHVPTFMELLSDAGECFQLLNQRWEPPTLTPIGF